MSKVDRMKALIKDLNRASKAYYTTGKEIMSNLEYDEKYDELKSLEEELGVVMSNSPTVNVGYLVVDNLPKQQHESRMLSLNKTKSVSELVSFLGEKVGLLSYKLDGLTIVLTYKNGELFNAVTRGNGEVGEVITNNAKAFKNIPLRVKDKGDLIVRAEAVIKYSDFIKLNENLSPVEQYKNPRNLCSGTVRALDSTVVKDRSVNCYVFSVVKMDKSLPTKSEQLDYVKNLGFDIVEYEKVDAKRIDKSVKKFKETLADKDVGSDGLVLTYDDIAYSASLGATSKFPRDAIAFKWQDELATTKLKDVLFSPSRTGLINPIAIFEPVELEGTTVSRASIHNISIMESLELGIGDEIKVYKANMIIPQIASNITKSNSITVPSKCPTCGKETELLESGGVKVLVCGNPDCFSKKIKGFTHFVSRDCMNIEGMSEKLAHRLIDEGIIASLSDVFRVSEHKDKIVSMEGFGEKSYNNLVNAIEKSKRVKMGNFLNALAIKNVGLINSKSVAKAFNDDIHKIINASEEELMAIDGIGPNMASEMVSFFKNPDNKKLVEELLRFITFEKETFNDKLRDLTFVITGSLNEYANRNALVEYINSMSGKVSSTVTKKTDYLINNDATSSSSKNKKAKQLGVKIITENEFKELVDGL